MNKKTLTKALAINVVVLVLVVALLGGLTFAWFSTRQTADTTQVIQVGNFAINLNDTTQEYAQSQNIAFTKAFPSTRAVANADDTAVQGGTENYDYLTGNKFAFSISNKGDIDALFGFDVVVNGANNANLTKAMRFDVYKKDDPNGTKTFDGIKYVISNTDEITNIADLKAELVKVVGDEKVPTSSNDATLVESGLAKIAVGANEIELLIVAWIDPSATYGDGADDVKVGDTFEFAVQMAAIQAVGGITKADINTADIFANMPPQTWTTFYTFSDNVNSDETFTKEYTYKYTMNGIGVAPYLDNAKTGAYGNKIAINLNNASTTGKAAVWTVTAEVDSTVTAADIQASFNGTVVKGLDNIKAQLDAISLTGSANTEIIIIIWTENADDQAKLISLKFTATNTVAP